MTLERFRLDGRVAFVTGAGSGIGKASAEALAEAGATVVGADIKGTDVQLDVSDRAAVHNAIDDVVAQHGRLDVMCNIAGVMQERLVLDLDEDALEELFKVNLRGVLWGCQAAARVMVEAGNGGSIINMSSGAIDTPAPKLVSYAMAKAAVAQLTHTLATEVARNGVRVNAVAPGFVISGMTGRHFTNADGTIDEAKKEEVSKFMGSVAPLGRVGQPDDIAAAVLYLASDASSFMTGQILRPNGGVSMPW